MFVLHGAMGVFDEVFFVAAIVMAGFALACLAAYFIQLGKEQRVDGVEAEEPSV